MRSEVFTVAKMWIVVFWVVRPCTLLRGYQRFRETYQLHLLGTDVKMEVIHSSEMLVTTYKTMTKI
jgi:hypothetical protein